MVCMFDHNDECNCSCLDCVRYQPNECCKCGAKKKLSLYEGEYYCPDCLAEMLIGNETESVIAMYLDRNIESFARFVAAYERA